MSQSNTADEGASVGAATAEIENPPPPPAASATDCRHKPCDAECKDSGTGRATSIVWDHFTPFVAANGKPKAKCNYCPQEYMADTKRNGTSNLLNHMEKCKNFPRDGIDAKQTQLSLQTIYEGQESNASSLTTWRFDAELCRRKLVEMIIKDELPFRLVDGEGFQEFVKTLQPRFRLISRWTISRDCYQLYLNEKLKLRDFFIASGQSVCITTDTWTSLQRLNYICITAHFVDKDWKFNKKIINFCTIERHRGEDLGRQIDGCLREWGISRVISVTVDNASSNDTCLAYLKPRLTSRGVCLVKGKFLHMRCVAHIIALVVNDGLKEIGSAVKKIREAVRFIRQSPARFVKFRECCVEEGVISKSGLCLDVATRWNSTYLMLDAACKFEKAFDVYGEKDPFYITDLDDGPPMCGDWDNGKRMCELLKSFFDLTTRISASKYVTCNSYLHEITSVSSMLRDWIASDDSELRAMGTKMMAKFNKYWGDPTKMNELIFLSVLIDPAYKYKFVVWTLIEEYGEEVGQKVAQSVLASLHELYAAYKEIYAPEITAPDATDSTSHSETSSQTGRRRVLAEKYKRQRVKQASISNINEIDVYLSETDVESDDDNILVWWKLNQHRFPILSRVARDILAVPISTVASESAFSTGGRVLDAFRSSLTPKIVESLICTQDWLRKSNQSISIEETLEDIAKHEEGLKNLSLNADNEVIESQPQPQEPATATDMETG